MIRPDVGRLTGPDAGVGRLPDPAELFAVAVSVLEDPSTAVRAAGQDMAGLKVAVSAGGTREHAGSSALSRQLLVGSDGLGARRAAVLRGAEVRLVAANVGLPAPPGTELEAVGSTADLAQAMAVAAKDADIAVMAAAPADFTPATTSQTKIRKRLDGGLELNLVQTIDVLASLVERQNRRAPSARRLCRRNAQRRTNADRSRPRQARTQGLRPAGPERGRPESGLRAAGQRDHSFESRRRTADRLAEAKDTLAHQIWDEALALRSRR